MSRLDKIKSKAEDLRKQYRPYMDALDASPLAKVRSISEMDYFNLGVQLDQFADYKEMCENDGTLSQLGTIPKIALDVITAVYGSSPLSVMASVQPIDEETGTVYFRSVTARDTRGNVTAGNTITGSDAAPNVEPLGYAIDGSINADSGVNTAAGTLAYSFTISGFLPLRKFKTKVTIKPNATFLGLECRDIDGNGTLVGSGIWGTVNYTTGLVNITLGADPTGDANARDILYSAAQEMAAATTLPRISTEFLNKSVTAEVYALSSSIGLEKAWALNKRFGIIADDQLAQDLVGAINAELCFQAISRLMANTTDDVTWSKTPSAGVAYADHKQELKDKLAEVDAKILQRAGRGQMTTIIAGRDIAATLSTLPGFVKLNVADSLGPHVFGTLDGVTVIRVPLATILPAGKAICLYRGTNPFDSALVYAPYMPLVVTTALPTANPLMNQKAAAVWAAVEVLVPGFASRLVQT